MVSCKLFGASVASAVWSIKKSKTLRVKAMACKTLELSSKVEKFTCTFLLRVRVPGNIELYKATKFFLVNNVKLEMDMSCQTISKRTLDALLLYEIIGVFNH